MTNPDFIELEREKVYAAVSLLTGLSRDELDELGGFGPDSNATIRVES